MTIYRRMYNTEMTLESIEVSEEDALRFELEELDLEEIWDDYEIIKKVQPTHNYDKQVNQEIEYGFQIRFHIFYSGFHPRSNVFELFEIVLFGCKIIDKIFPFYTGKCKRCLSYSSSSVDDI